MTDKVQKIREEVERLMYGYNLEADVASGEDAETEKLADIKYQLCKKILEYIDSLQKEPVSEDLEEAMRHDAPDNIGIDDLLYWRNGFIAGAKWQKQKEQSTIELAEDHAMLAGMEKMKEEMMENAIGGLWLRRNRCTKQNVLQGFDVTHDVFQKFKDRDKLKIIVIKED